MNPLRTQWAFDASGLRSKSMSDIMRLRRQWETFERVENYNDIIYQKLTQGNRSELYYQFQTSEELHEYRNGQQQHSTKYPSVSFASISDKYPATQFTGPAPYMSYPIKQNATFAQAIQSSEKTFQQNDLAIYAYASTYNAEHVVQYIFPSNEEKMAYDRAEQRVRNENAQSS
jgi:hypothetical protein